MIRIGILGLAHGHVMSYGQEWVDHPEYGVQVAGIWDHDDKRLKETCEKFSAQPFDSVEALLSSDISAVCISSETCYHAELVEKAAAAGKDIILYKPMALTMAEADRIVEAVRRNGVRFSMGWQMRVDPQNQKMKEMIDSKELGPVCSFRRRHGLSTHTWGNFENSWHTAPEKNRDIFADDSSHPIDLMHWIFGMPETVSCEMSTLFNPGIPNNNGIALFKYDNGMIAEIYCCFTCVASEITTEVYCENGSIQQYFGDAVSASLPRVPGMPGLKWYRRGDERWTESDIPSPAGHGERIKAQGKRLAEFLNGGEAVCSAEEARDSLRLVLACYLSVREGGRVSVWDDRVYEI